MRSLALVAGRSEDLIVKAWYRKTSAIEWVDTQLVLYTVKLARWSIPRVQIVPKHLVLYAE